MKISINLFSLYFLELFIHGAHSSVFTITNNCPYTIWPALLTGSGAPLAITGFQLNPKTSANVNVPSPWSGRVWGRTYCSVVNGRFTCATGDCGSGQVQCPGAGGRPPVSLVEMTLAAPGGTDYYDISLVDGFNLPVQVFPRGCNAVTCSANINSQCPPELALGSNIGAIGCKSACIAFNQPQYCCTGPYGTPDKCKPTNYSRFFKSRCPQAYSYAYDDKSSLFTCRSGANYQITFCP